MADQDRDQRNYTSDSSFLSSDSEAEEEIIWYLGQANRKDLRGYQFEPTRIQMNQEPPKSSSESDDDEYDSDDSSEPESYHVPETEEAQLPPIPDAEFCKCGLCKSDTLSYASEAVCCFSKNFKPIWENEEQICITLHKDFEGCVLAPAVLRNTMVLMNQHRGDALNVDAVANVIDTLHTLHSHAGCTRVNWIEKTVS